MEENFVTVDLEEGASARWAVSENDAGAILEYLISTYGEPDTIRA